MTQVLYNIRYVPQQTEDTCWAACLEMWATTEGLAYFSRDQYASAAQQGLVWGPNGVDPDALGDFIFNSINSLNQIGALKLMNIVEVGQSTDLPDFVDILTNIGTIFVAFKWPGRLAGHCRVLFGIDDNNNFIAADPLPNVQRTVDPYSFYFSAIPAVVAWKMPQQFGGL
jgi:hypothetical protein